MNSLLYGTTVLDLTNVLSGPFCGFQLALFGARVVKIEKIDGGDLARKLGDDKIGAEKLMGATFMAFNGGKESICLDIKSDQGKKILLKMVEKSDVLIENFRPGVMDKLGLSYDVLSKVNPKLIYCAISGFGSSGPLSKRPAYDQIIQGMSGVMKVTGDLESSPLKVGFPLCDTIGGLTAAFAVSSALVGANKTGKGAFLDVSMLESTITAMGWPVSGLLNAGVEPKATGNTNPTSAPSGTFETKNGLLNIAANEDHQFINLCKAIGKDHLIYDERFSNRNNRKKFREELNKEIESALVKEETKFWDERLNEFGVPSGPILSLKEILNHEQIKETGFIKKFDDSNKYCTLGGVKVNNKRPSLAKNPPILSENTFSWMKEIGLENEDIEKLRISGCISY